MSTRRLPNSHRPIYGATMRYQNSELRIDELASYFRDGKISLIPPFQRGRVWRLPMRQKLMANMIQGKPIPAIFLYKEEDGTRFTYNILDGKQRLESLLLFIGDERQDLAIRNWRQYFFQGHSEAHYAIKIGPPGEKETPKTFAQLDEDLIRHFREYRIPTIEIELNPDDEEGSFDEIISLFIDINSYGVRVNRFDIIKTMKEKNQLLADTFDLVAMKQKRKKDYFIKTKESDFANILKRLNSVKAVSGRQPQVDRVWERMLEIVLFVRTGTHRTLAQILKAFMGLKVDSNPLTGGERATLRRMFTTLRSVFAQAGMKTSQLAVNQTHFYTLATSLHALNLLEEYEPNELKRKLAAFAAMIEDPRQAPAGKHKAMREYMTLSSQKTTHPGRRMDRQRLFADILAAI
jgi:hypothetical protein